MENLFRQEVIKYRNLKLEGSISLIQPPTFKYLTALLLAITLLSLLFLSLGSYSRKEQVAGVVQPRKGIIKVISPQEGVIEKLFVTEGQSVKAGSVLLRIKTERHGENGFELNQSLIQQYQTQIDSFQQQLVKQKRQNSLQLENLQSSLQNLEREHEQVLRNQKLLNTRISINQDIKKQIDTLSESGYISELELKRQNDSILALQQQRLSLDSELLSVIHQARQIENQLTRLPIQHSVELATIDERLNETRLLLSRAKQQKVAELIAPIDGVVTGSLIDEGNTVRGQQNLLSLVPQNSELAALLYIPTSAVGFVEIGQHVKIRYKAFPYEKFGIYRGVIAEVSNIVILPSEISSSTPVNVPSYRIKVKLEQQAITAYGQDFSLRPGMQLDADIIIEKRSLLQWLFAPIFRLKG